MSDAFVSYAPQDVEWVRHLAGRLGAEGLEVTYEEMLRSPGKIVVEVIEQAIRDAAHGILIFSRAALSDPWVHQAYATLMRRSVEGGQRFIPVLVEDVELPEFAADRFWVDLSPVDGPDHDRRLDELVRALRGRLPEVIPGPAVRPGSGVRPEKPRHCTLRISPDEVTLQTSAYGGTLRPPAHEAGRQAPAAEAPARVNHSPTRTSVLNELLWRLGSARARGAHVTRGPDGSGGVGTLLAECGRELGRAYLTGAAGEALAAELAGAHALGATLRLGLEVSEELADLPWEALTAPGMPEPLALHPRVQFYRRASTGTVPAIAIRGPLRILVAVAAPEGPGGGAVLDLEAELAKILDSVERARRGGLGRPGAYVRILNRGTLDGIREALLQERFHVLHISCHAEPGALLLEDAAGRADRVSTERLVGEGLLTDRGVPLLVLSGCSTALDAPAARTSGDEPALAGLARGLTSAGVPSVLAMTASVTDPYATALAGQLYYELAVREVPEVLPAFCDARRRLEEERRRLPPGSLGASLVEWATPALFLRGPSLSLYAAADGFEEISAPAEPRFADGVPLRKVGEFVGRRSEIRTALGALRDDGPGVLLHGIGGVGKSSLAAELLRDLGPDAGLVVSAVSETSPDQLLEEIGRTLLTAFTDERTRQLALAVRQPQDEWADRLQALGQLLAGAPVTLLLDNFEDNLDHDGTEWQVRNGELAEFLTAWIRLRGKHKLLITSRYPFPLPRRADRRLHVHHLGPLSWAETRKLMWRLPGLDALPVADQRRAWLDVGGHPRTLEYLDALLRGGEARFDDVRERLEDLLDRRGIPDPAAWLRTAGSGLDAALAEAVTLAVDDTLLGELVGLLDDFSREVLVGASVYRLPVDRTGVGWPVATPVEDDPARRERLEQLSELLERTRRENLEGKLEDPGLSLAEVALAWADVAPLQAPPVVEPPGVEGALEVLARLGLLAPGEGSVGPDGERSFTVHRWTAATLARSQVASDARLREAHAAAARFWQWRVNTRPQSAQQDLDEILEVRFHRHMAGDLDGAAATMDWICEQLHTWGAWGWEEQLCRETLSWFAAGSQQQGAGLHRLGVIAQARGEYEQALEYYHQALTISQELGYRAGTASSYHKLGQVAQARGEYEQALEYYHQALTINEDLGDRADMAGSYHQLGTLAQRQGKHEQALEYYHQALTISEELGDRAGAANSYHSFGVIAQKRGEYERALEYYHQALTINEDIGNRAGTAGIYHNLGVIAQEQGEYEQALEYYHQALTINEDIGDRADMAGSYSQIGALYTEMRGAAEAVGYSVRGLVIHIELQSPWSRFDLYRLGRQREALGESEFRRLLAEHLTVDDLDVDTIIGLLDQPDE